MKTVMIYVGAGALWFTYFQFLDCTFMRIQGLDYTIGLSGFFGALVKALTPC
jgi:hypothetical protein